MKRPRNPVLSPEEVRWKRILFSPKDCCYRSRLICLLKQELKKMEEINDLMCYEICEYFIARTGNLAEDT